MLPSNSTRLSETYLTWRPSITSLVHSEEVFSTIMWVCTALSLMHRFTFSDWKSETHSDDRDFNRWIERELSFFNLAVFLNGRMSSKISDWKFRIESNDQQWSIESQITNQELALKLPRLLSRCYNFSNHPILHLSSHYMYRRKHSAFLHLCQYVFPLVKTPCLPPNRLHLLLQISGMHYQIIHSSSISTLPVYRRALKHHLFLLAYPDSSAKKSVRIKPAQCITLRATAPITVIAQAGNTMPSI